MQITREDNGQRGRYVARIDGVADEAELVFTHRGDGLVSADHTGVPPEAEGKGVGSALVERMVADARAEGWRIQPNCAFVRAQAARHPDWSDVIAG